MEDIPAKELEKICGGVLYNSSLGLTPTGVSTDSRKVKPGDLFVALQGENCDGNEFVEDAFQSGASIALVSKKETIQTGKPVILVDDTLAALQKLAAWWRMRFSIPVIGVTGSSGKTTTKDILTSLIAVVRTVHRSTGNFNNEIGVPLTLLGLRTDHQVCVLEMAMRNLGEIKALCDLAKPTGGVITNVGTTHFERLGSQENIARAKGELAASIPQEGFLLLNSDNQWFPFISEMTGARIISFGFGEKADIKAGDVDFHSEGTEFTLTAFGASQRIRLPLWGEHNVYNSLASAGVYLMLGFPPEALQEGFSKVSITKMRLEKTMGIRGSLIINDTYNANPGSMLASLEVLRQVGGRRTIAVLGDMLELGDIEVEEHKKVGAGVYEKGVDVLVTVGKLAEKISEEAVALGMDPRNVFHGGTVEEAEDFLLKSIKTKDVVLVKGSRGMKMERIVSALRNEEKSHV